MHGIDLARRGAVMRLAIDGGRVGCPREGDTDVERCLTCGYLDDVDDADRPRVVGCRWRGPLPAAPVDAFDLASRYTL
jgi:hypothetical protein